MVLLIERIQKNLGGYVKAPSADSRVAEVGEVRTFIVHGHDPQSALELKDYLQNTLDLGEPVVLRQTPSAGKTIIENSSTKLNLSN
jgi:predicted nucleotide-binding protein